MLAAGGEGEGAGPRCDGQRWGVGIGVLGARLGEGVERVGGGEGGALARRYLSGAPPHAPSISQATPSCQERAGCRMGSPH